MNYFDFCKQVNYEEPGSSNPYAFKHYNPNLISKPTMLLLLAIHLNMNYV